MATAGEEAAGAAAKAAAAAPVKLFSRAEVAERKDSKDTWLVIHNNVYDVTSFLNEHPGGEEVLLEQSGKDASEAFEDVGHSTDARQMMEPFKVGEIIKEERIESGSVKASGYAKDSADDESSGSWRSWLIPIALGVLATLVYRYFISNR